MGHHTGIFILNSFYGNISTRTLLRWYVLKREPPDTLYAEWYRTRNHQGAPGCQKPRAIPVRCWRRQDRNSLERHRNYTFELMIPWSLQSDALTFGPSLYLGFQQEKLSTGCLRDRPSNLPPYAADHPADPYKLRKAQSGHPMGRYFT